MGAKKKVNLIRDNGMVKLSNAIDKLKFAVYEGLYIPQIVEWLSKRLK